MQARALSKKKEKRERDSIAIVTSLKHGNKDEFLGEQLYLILLKHPGTLLNASI